VAPDYLLELMNDKNKEICKLCSKTLDIILVRPPTVGAVLCPWNGGLSVVVVGGGTES
jgi:hypothetical protein